MLRDVPLKRYQSGNTACSQFCSCRLHCIDTIGCFRTAHIRSSQGDTPTKTPAVWLPRRAEQHKATLCNRNNKEESGAEAQRDNKHNKDVTKLAGFPAWCLRPACEVRRCLSFKNVRATLEVWSRRFPLIDTSPATCCLHSPAPASRWTLQLVALIYIQEPRGGAQSHTHMHTHTALQARTHTRALIKHTRKVNNLTGVKPSFSLPPSLSFALILFYFFISAFFQHQNSSAPEY